ncbi:hypothetical protein HDV00_006435 [Rhizophlyctis rosea]|nr:hypothetical protein HDV00_006435 [Rhizophlyctis rosea]
MDSDSEDGNVFPGLTSDNSKSDDDSLIPAQEAVRIGTSVDLTFDFPPRPRSIKIAEDSSGGCGGKVYRQSQATPTTSFLTPATKVVELGAGTGVVGILAAMLAATAPTPTPPPQQPQIAITDMLFLDLMRKNVEMNLTYEERRLVFIEELTWGEPLKPTITPPYDIILAADCVYLEAAFDPLIQALLQLSSPSTEIIICSKKRRKADKRFFIKLRKVFNVVEVKDDPHYEDFNKQSLTIYYARKKSGSS